jgi:CubicO group peptidase (beta-lactamase class C family)
MQKILNRVLQLVIVGILVLTALQSLAQNEIVEQRMTELMKAKPVMGISVAVVKNNRIAYAHSFGLKDMEKAEPLTDECIFRIASISKSFTATSLMQLVEQGKVALEEDFSNLIGFRVRNPKYPETVITLEMVLSHRSSINDSQGYFSLDPINPAKNPNWAKGYNDYEPGKGYMYCNLNYNMAGAVIERLTGERFDLYVKHHILDPLGVYGGYCVDSLDKSKLATLYAYEPDSAKFIASPSAYIQNKEVLANYKLGESTPVFSPTGGMKISATGLAKVMLMHMKFGKSNGKRIISKKSSRRMQTPLSPDENYGFAIMKTDKMIAGKTMTGHTGSAYGLYSALFFNSKEKFGIVVISNGCHPKYTEGFNDVIRSTVNILYEEVVGKD